MPLPTFEPPVRPSPGTAHKPTVNLWKADFGDGYSQPTPKGINHIKKSVSLTWDVLTTEQMFEIVEFFEARGGNEAFYFDPFGERGMMKWTCEEWDHDTEGGIWKVTAKLDQSNTNAT